MKITVKNLGALKEATFELGKFTIICGKNNTGKTYATYALNGFLHFWREVITLNVPPEKIEQLFQTGATDLDIDTYLSNATSIVDEGCANYKKLLPFVFAASENRFAETEFTIDLDNTDIKPLEAFERTMGAPQNQLFTIKKNRNQSHVSISLLVDKDDVVVKKDEIAATIANSLQDIIFGHLFPNPFIASAERTGAAIFRKELDIARNRMLDMMKNQKDFNIGDFFDKNHKDYAFAVKINVDYTRKLEDFAKRDSFITKDHPSLLSDFSDIIGGEYAVTRDDELYFKPKGKKLKLTMDESSSAVRSLLLIGFYLKHIAKPDDILLIDEPELNLHPENQRKVARLLARLVNIGVKVFVTTHSDYFIKELNLLILLHAQKPHHLEIMKAEKYKKEELLDYKNLSVYIAEEASIKLNGGDRKTKCQTLTKASVSQESGIEAKSFDETIEEMNRIQDEIVWGGE